MPNIGEAHGAKIPSPQRSRAMRTLPSRRPQENIALPLDNLGREILQLDQRLGSYRREIEQSGHAGFSLEQQLEILAIKFRAIKAMKTALRLDEFALHEWATSSTSYGPQLTLQQAAKISGTSAATISSRKPNEDLIRNKQSRRQSRTRKALLDNEISKALEATTPRKHEKA